jgi:hypothetical protein
LAKAKGMIIRKQVYDLTAADLDQYPIWQYALDEEGTLGQDEATVRPLEKVPQSKEDRSQVLLAATRKLADETLHYGIINCPRRSDWDISDLAPAMLAPGGMLSFWQGVRKPRPETIAVAYERIGKSAKQIFPVQLESLVEVDGEHIRIVLKGFYHYDWEPGQRMYPFEKYLRLQVTVGE